MSKTRIKIYSVIALLSLGYRAYEGDSTGVVLSLLVLSLIFLRLSYGNSQ